MPGGSVMLVCVGLRSMSMGPWGVGSVPRAQARPARSGAALLCGNRLPWDGCRVSLPSAMRWGRTTSRAPARQSSRRCRRPAARHAGCSWASGCRRPPRSWLLPRDHSSPVLANPREGLRAVAGGCHRREDVGVVEGRDGRLAEARVRGVGEGRGPDRWVLRRRGGAGEDGHAVDLPSAAKGAGGGIEQMALGSGGELGGGLIAAGCGGVVAQLAQQEGGVAEGEDVLELGAAAGLGRVAGEVGGQSMKGQSLDLSAKRWPASISASMVASRSTRRRCTLFR